MIEVASKYFGQSKQIDWVIKHACRGLLKQGHKKVLAMFGYADASHVVINNFSIDRLVKLGDNLNFQFEVKTKDKNLGKLRIEFVIDFMKANGKTSGKIFKVCEGEYLSSQKSINKYFSFRPISTRKYYVGRHRISIVINGKKVTGESFELLT